MTPQTSKKNPPLPVRKISETFLEFSSLLLQDLPSDASERQIEDILRFGWTLWNAIVLDDVQGISTHLGMVMSQMKGSVIGSVMVCALIERKRRDFDDDQRLIGNYRISRKNGELRLWAEARDPYTIGKNTMSNQAS